MWNQMRNLYQYFQIFSTVNVLIKRKNTHTALNEKRKAEKVELCFITGCLIKSFGIASFLKIFSSSFATQFLYFDIRDIKTGSSKWQIATIVFIIFSDFLTFHQIFLSPQVKRCLIITYKHDIYELPHDLPSNLRLRILGNYEIWRKCLSSTKW